MIKLVTAMTFATLAMPATAELGNSDSRAAVAVRRAPTVAPEIMLQDDRSFRQLYADLLAFESAPQAPPEIRITVARAAEVVGKPVYFSRSSISGLGSIITLSQNRLPTVVATRRAGNWSAPRAMSAARLTSGFGMRAHPILGSSRLHLGIDLAAPAGTPVVATSDGIVSTAQWAGGYGLLVQLDHAGGLQTRYGHLSQLNVASGQHVARGEVIGFVGSTGRSTGPHLHYETRLHGQAVNPLSTGVARR